MAKAAFYTGIGLSGGETAFDETGRFPYSGAPVASLKTEEGYKVRLYRDHGDFLELRGTERNTSQSGWCCGVSEIEILPDSPVTDPDILSYNYVIGTQDFAGGYGFTDENRQLEVARRIWEMGSNIIKLPSNRQSLDEILAACPFRYVAIWYHESGANWSDGFDEEDERKEYSGMYAYASALLRDYDNSGITFYLGHWEGDWLLTGTNPAVKEVPEFRYKGMAMWLNTRQKAVDDAKRNILHKNVQVYNYAEMNRTTDVSLGMDRIANKVMPYTDVDYLSYSAYDIQQLPFDMVRDVLAYSESTLKPRPGIEGRRIFIGETSFPWELTYTQENHNKVNVEFFLKYLRLRVPHILYWEMYNNEVMKDGRQRGFWLIDEKNQKWMLYYTIKSLFDTGREYIRTYRDQNGLLPTLDEYSGFAADFLSRRI